MSVHADARVLLESAVRDEVRRSGIDPLSSADEVRRLTQQALSELDLVLDSGAGVADGGSGLVREVVDAIAGFGPLQRWLDDPEVEEIWINEPSRVFVARHGRSELTTTILSEGEVRDLIERMLAACGRRVDVSTPFVDGVLPDGSRLHVVIPDIVSAWAVNIRKFVAPARDLLGLVEMGMMTTHAANFLRASVVAGCNIVVSGGTGAGQTTMLTCLLNEIPSGMRIITCEEIFELKLSVPDWIAMQTRQAGLEGTGEVRLRRLVKESLRMRPDRLVIGEVRQEEALDMLIALNSGQPGACTVHANSARDAVMKLCTLPLLAGENIASAFVVPTVASAIDLILHVGVSADGRRQVEEIVALPGRVEEGVVETADIFHRHGGELVRASGYPPHADRYRRAGYDLSRLLDERARRDPNPAPDLGGSN